MAWVHLPIAHSPALTMSAEANIYLINFLKEKKC